MFIDTHCHLTDDYCNDANEIISRARQHNVDTIICATADSEAIQPTLDLANKFENIFCTIGIHPDHTDTKVKDFLTFDILNHKRVVGIGEIGLDYHERADNKKEQIQLFEEQLYLALQYKMPVAIHTRDAEEDTKNILTNKYNGVMHCFTSSWDLAKTMLDRGFFFSASGILTFKNAEEVRETFKKIPNDRIVIETDAPYCAPVPYRGKQCEPFMVIETAKVLAQIKGLQIEDLAYILRNNVKQLYPKISI